MAMLVRSIDDDMAVNDMSAESLQPLRKISDAQVHCL